MYLNIDFHSKKFWFWTIIIALLFLYVFSPNVNIKPLSAISEERVSDAVVEDGNLKMENMPSPMLEQNSAPRTFMAKSMGTNNNLDDFAEDERKLKKNFSLDLVVDDIDLFEKNLKDLLSQYDAYIKNSSHSNYNNNEHLYLTIKVDSENVDNFLANIKSKVKFVENESINIDDVTMRYADLKARLKNARSEEEQYLKILDKATRTEDVLKVTQYLNTVRAKIESMQAQMKVLNNQVDYAVVNMNVRKLNKIDKVSDEWNLSQTISKAISDLIDNVKNGIESFVYYIITNVFKLFLYLIIIVAIYIFYKKQIKNS